MAKEATTTTTTPPTTPPPSGRKRYGSAPGGSGGPAGAGTGGGGPQQGGGSLLADLRLCSRAMEVLLKDWKAPLRCRPYTKLEGIDNRPEVHKGDEDYWRSKRRSVVVPQDLIHTWNESDGRSNDEATARRIPLAGRPLPAPAPIPPRKAVEAALDSGWGGTQDDAGTLTTSADTTTGRASLRRRSLSSGNIEALEHLAPLDVGALVCQLPSPTAKD